MLKCLPSMKILKRKAKSRTDISVIVNDKIFWRLLFADTHGANFSLRMCEAL